MQNLLENGIIQSIKQIKGDIEESFIAAIPICLGYLPLGFACGVLAQKAGLTIFEIAGMSLIVFAGSSQFIAVSMIGANSSIEAIIMATFVVNLRHFLMSSVLAKFLGSKKKNFLLIYSHGVTDESFACWNFGNLIGSLVGAILPVSNEIASYTLTAMFICLLVLNLKNKVFIIVGIITGAASICLSLILKNSFYIVLTAILGASVGYFIENKMIKKKREKNNVE